MTSKITEKTLIPVSLLIVIVGGVVWLTNMYFLSVRNAEAITKLEQKQDSYGTSIEEIRLRLTRIEVKLERAIEK